MNFQSTTLSALTGFEWIRGAKDAVYPATIVRIPPMEDFYIGGASVKLFLPIFKMNFPEIQDAGRRLNLIPSSRAHF